MSRRDRELRTTITVGEYSFDMKITRDILQNALSKSEGVWAYMQKQQEAENVDASKLSAKEFVQVAMEQEKFYEDLDDFIADILPKMIEAAYEDKESEFKGTVDEFLDYCDDNGVLDDVELKIFQFAMLGFTGGRGNTTTEPKLKVIMN